MIDINDYNREDLIASCLMEAANVMSESYGAHGTMERLAKERLKNAKTNSEKKFYESSVDHYYENRHAPKTEKSGRHANDCSATTSSIFCERKSKHPENEELHAKINGKERMRNLFKSNKSMNESIDLANTILDLLDED